MNADQRVFSNLFFCDDFRAFCGFFGVHRFGFVIRLRSFYVFRIFSSDFGQVRIFLIREFRARRRVAMRLCGATVEVPYGANVPNLANRSFRCLIVRPRVGGHVRRAQREDAYSKAGKGRREILGVTRLQLRRSFGVLGYFFCFVFRRDCSFVLSRFVVFNAGIYYSDGSKEGEGPSGIRFYGVNAFTAWWVLRINLTFYLTVAGDVGSFFIRGVCLGLSVKFFYSRVWMCFMGRGAFDRGDFYWGTVSALRSLLFREVRVGPRGVPVFTGWFVELIWG